MEILGRPNDRAVQDQDGFSEPLHVQFERVRERFGLHLLGCRGGWKLDDRQPSWHKLPDFGVGAFGRQ